MNTTMKKTIAAGALGAIALTSISAVSANVTGASVPAQEIAQVADIEVSKADILASLKIEVSELTDKSFQAKMSKSAEALAKITDDTAFNAEINKIFAQLDSHYGYTVSEEDTFDVTEMKKELISDLTKELEYVKDAKVAKQAADLMSGLASITDADALFTKLDSVYALLDAHYETLGDDMPELGKDISFEDAKKQILELLTEDASSLKEEGLDISATVEKLGTITNENEFFGALDSLSDTIEKHLETVEDAHDDNEVELKDGDFPEFEESSENEDDEEDKGEEVELKDGDFPEFDEDMTGLVPDAPKEDTSVRADENFDDIEKVEYIENFKPDTPKEDESISPDENFDDIEKAEDDKDEEEDSNKK